MAGFIFRLQTLLNVKIQLENNIKNELGVAIKRLEEEKEILYTMEKQKESIELEFNEKASFGTKAGELFLFSTFIEKITTDIKNQKNIIKNSEDNVDKVRERLVKAVQERKVIEKLREKEYVKYTKEQLKKEQKLNDELVSYKQTKQENE